MSCGHLCRGSHSCGLGGRRVGPVGGSGIGGRFSPRAGEAPLLARGDDGPPGAPSYASAPPAVPAPPRGPRRGQGPVEPGIPAVQPLEGAEGSRCGGLGRPRGPLGKPTTSGGGPGAAQPGAARAAGEAGAAHIAVPAGSVQGRSAGSGPLRAAGGVCRDCRYSGGGGVAYAGDPAGCGAGGPPGMQRRCT